MTTLLFLDDWPLHICQGFVRRAGTPAWVPEATLEDDLVEGTWNYPFVRFDPDLGRWRAWYAGVSYRASDSGTRRQFLGLLYAESPDGIHWHKPDVGERVALPHGARRRRPNQVFSYHDSYADGGPVYHDPRDPDPARRFKYLFSTRDAKGVGTEWLATSPDGLTWTIAAEPWGRRAIDTLYCAYWNAQRQSYCVAARPGIHDRRVALMETPDFARFSPPQVVVHPDLLDPPLLQFYGMPVYPYEDLYLGLLQLYHADPDEGGGHKVKGYVDGGLTYSYDGWIFNRTLREPFLPRTPRGEQGSGGIYPCALLVDAGHQVRIYSAGARAAHFQSRQIPDAALLLHTLRLDGFMYLDSGPGTARLQTRRLRFSGPDLRLNVRAPQGRLRVQLSEADGTPIPGYTFQECLPFSGDDLFYQPRWEGGATPAAVGDRLVHVEVELFHGELYAMRGDFTLVVSVPPTRGVV